MLLKIKPMRSLSAVVAALILTLSTHAFADGQNAITHPPIEAAQPEVLIVTSMGEFVVQLNPEKAPKTVANFLSYVDAGHYKDTIFHRVISNFMIQGGGFDKDMRRKAAMQTVENEADNGLGNELGTIAMARTNDPHSASAQFFINTQDNPFLNHSSKTQRGWGYTVFGKVIAGGEFVQKIKRVATTTKNGMRDVPVEPVVIYDIKRI